MEPSHYASTLEEAIKKESSLFQEYFLWLESAMPEIFFKEMSGENCLLITHSLMGFDLLNHFCLINLKSSSIALCLNTPDADLRILKNYAFYGIKTYQSYVSSKPFPGTQLPLRIATLAFTSFDEKAVITDSQREDLLKALKTENTELSEEEMKQWLLKLPPPFVHALPVDRLSIALEMINRAQTRDNCQYQVRYQENWKSNDTASMHIILAWKNTPKHHFLYRLAQVIHRHDLVMERVNAAYLDPYQKQSILTMVLSLHGRNGQPVWDVAEIPDFLREMATVKYFETDDRIQNILVDPKIISGNMANFLRSMTVFIHQALVHIDSNLYTVENVEEAICRHPELTVQLCEAFKLKFSAFQHNFDHYLIARNQFLDDVAELNTGHESNDIRRKNIFLQGMNFIHHTLKTNFFRLNYTAHSFRLDPKYLDHIPFKRTEKFPELPFAIFFMRGLHFFGFHIRFKDLARGGLRTVYPEQLEQMNVERNNVFTECYNLAWTQHKKNKDIPEAGAKGILFLKPFDQIDLESQILRNEFEREKRLPSEIEQKIKEFRQEQRVEYLYQSQRSYIESLVTIVNCEPDGTIRARHIVDYWGRPEYLYLGPDENMHDFMIQWIADFSKKYNYKPGGAFISSKPKAGINHKEYGVTSLGVNVYMHQVLEYIGINPKEQEFTVKMAGGPDGDVAGNQLLNLYNLYPNTAKLIALKDKTGTINDPKGLNLSILRDLFYQNKGICFYPPENLSDGGFLVNTSKKRYPSAYIQETLCWKKKDGKLIEEWLSGSDTNYILHHNIHHTYADIFIPAGGRPRTLNEGNINEFLDPTGKPTARAIVEGANLYFTQGARRILEEKGTLIIKDSSANKGGVICSSYEVLCGLTLDDDTFMENKGKLVEEILTRVKECSTYEADLLLRTHRETGEYLTAIAESISDHINLYTYQILDYLDLIPLPRDYNDPLIRSFLHYCLPTLSECYTEKLIEEIPEHHKKAIIACHLASHLVYQKGLGWSPSIIDILPLILAESTLSH